MSALRRAEQQLACDIAYRLAVLRERGIIDARVMQVEIRGADVDVRLSAEPHPHSSRSVAAKICAALWGGNATTAR